MLPVPLTLPDTASKGAVLAMTRELAMVHAREGIRVNALCPCVARLDRTSDAPKRPVENTCDYLRAATAD